MRDIQRKAAIQLKKTQLRGALQTWGYQNIDHAIDTMVKYHGDTSGQVLKELTGKVEACKVFITENVGNMEKGEVPMCSDSMTTKGKAKRKEAESRGDGADQARCPKKSIRQEDGI